VVVLEHKLYVYNFQNLKMIEVVETCANPKGICAVSPSKEVCVLACPERKVGVVRVVHFDKDSKTTMINAHQSSIAAIAVNNDGTLLASASDKVFIDLLQILGNPSQTLGYRDRNLASGTPSWFRPC
jgi:hypothetical protein